MPLLPMSTMPRRWRGSRSATTTAILTISRSVSRSERSFSVRNVVICLGRFFLSYDRTRKEIGARNLKLRKLLLQLRQANQRQGDCLPLEGEQTSVVVRMPPLFSTSFTRGSRQCITNKGGKIREDHRRNAFENDRGERCGCEQKRLDE